MFHDAVRVGECEGHTTFDECLRHEVRHDGVDALLPLGPEAAVAVARLVEGTAGLLVHLLRLWG